MLSRASEQEKAMALLRASGYAVGGEIPGRPPGPPRVNADKPRIGAVNVIIANKGDDQELLQRGARIGAQAVATKLAGNPPLPVSPPPGGGIAAPPPLAAGPPMGTLPLGGSVPPGMIRPPMKSGGAVPSKIRVRAYQRRKSGGAI
jgi:hypothetical protein